MIQHLLYTGDAGCKPQQLEASPEWQDIYSPSYPGNYENDQDCTYTIHAPDSTVTLTIRTLELETGFDYLYIYDGDDEHASLIAKVTGTYAEETFSSTGNDMFIRFTSDDVVTRAGFYLQYQQTPGNNTL